jgi:hypothetical protein
MATINKALKIDTFEFDKAIDRFREAVWEAAQEDSRVDYDNAGRGVAAQLTELFIKAHTASTVAVMVAVTTPATLESLEKGESALISPVQFGTEANIPLYTIGDVKII